MEQTNSVFHNVTCLPVSVVIKKPVQDMKYGLSSRFMPPKDMPYERLTEAAMLHAVFFTGTQLYRARLTYTAR
jgi:hypothetical protein